MASLTVKKEIEVKVNMNQLVCGQALLEFSGNYKIADEFNRYSKADKVKIGHMTIDLDGLCTIDEDECYDQYIDGSLEKQDCKIRVSLLVDIKAKKYEDMVDGVVEAYRKYLEQVLPAYANIWYAQTELYSKNNKCIAVFG